MDIPLLCYQSVSLSVFLLPSTVHAQSVQFNEIKATPAKKFYDTKESTIVFPVVVSDNPAVSRLINNEIEESVLEYDSDDKEIKNDARQNPKLDKDRRADRSGL